VRSAEFRTPGGRGLLLVGKFSTRFGDWVFGLVWELPLGISPMRLWWGEIMFVGSLFRKGKKEVARLRHFLVFKFSGSFGLCVSARRGSPLTVQS